MLEYDWLLTALIYALIGCFRSKERLRCISNAWPCSTYIKNEWYSSDRM